jgi:hypothetical protein
MNFLIKQFKIKTNQLDKNDEGLELTTNYWIKTNQLDINQQFI